jgi:hypothetical protein
LAANMSLPLCVRRPRHGESAERVHKRTLTRHGKDDLCWGEELDVVGVVTLLGYRVRQPTYSFGSECTPPVPPTRVSTPSPTGRNLTKRQGVGQVWTVIGVAHHRGGVMACTKRAVGLSSD